MSGPTTFASHRLPVPTTRELPYHRSRLMLQTVRHGEPETDYVAALRREIMGEAQEVVLVVAINGNAVVSDPVEIARGDYHSVIVPLPALLAVPLLAGADRLVIAHNHPSGRLLPSKHDYALTRTVVEATNLCGMVLHDHIIFGPDGKHLSLREARVLEVPDLKPLEVQE
jgi:DNA repair protein RadC